jgi:hypothetical protein
LSIDWRSGTIPVAAPPGPFKEIAMTLIRKGLWAALVLGSATFAASAGASAAQVGVGVGPAPVVRPPVYSPVPRTMVYAPRPVYYARLPLVYAPAYAVGYPVRYPVAYGPIVVRPRVWVGPRLHWSHPRPMVRVGF